jgi:hypothetical protein
LVRERSRVQSSLAAPFKLNNFNSLSSAKPCGSHSSFFRGSTGEARGRISPLANAVFRPARPCRSRHLRSEPSRWFIAEHSAELDVVPDLRRRPGGGACAPGSPTVLVCPSTVMTRRPRQATHCCEQLPPLRGAVRQIQFPARRPRADEPPPPAQLEPLGVGHAGKEQSAYSVVYPADYATHVPICASVIGRSAPCRAAPSPWR